MTLETVNIIDATLVIALFLSSGIFIVGLLKIMKIFMDPVYFFDKVIAVEGAICCGIAIAIWIISCLFSGYEKNLQRDFYYQRVKEGYTVYMDGSEVNHPERLDVGDYRVVFMDDDEAIILNKKRKVIIWKLSNL